ncbi:hypothetical protein E1301_Tti008448 [Triplophysa tibetana]|uniref:Uncharacterized protein n=1 Tax=Triplophysa tibetana TaxID=1572043 RepID=A0A5A9P3E1_9TELE|nr:hypothetical protein E1301_Tti008448 [Triplophysa tibetana]
MEKCMLGNANYSATSEMSIKPPAPNIKKPCGQTTLTAPSSKYNQRKMKQKVVMRAPQHGGDEHGGKGHTFANRQACKHGGRDTGSIPHANAFANALDTEHDINFKNTPLHNELNLLIICMSEEFLFIDLLINKHIGERGVPACKGAVGTSVQAMSREERRGSESRDEPV